MLLLAVTLVAPPGEEGVPVTPVPTPTATTPFVSPTTLSAGEIFLYTSEEFENRTFTVPVDLTAPPMEVRYTVQPRWTTRPRDPSTLYPSPDSWFVVRIFDSEGDLVAENGYGLPAGEKGSFSQNEEGSLKVYASGWYTIVIRFEEMMVDIVVTSRA